MLWVPLSNSKIPFQKVLKELITFLNKSHMVGKKTYLIFLTLNQSWILWKNIGKKTYLIIYIYNIIWFKKKCCENWLGIWQDILDQWVFWWIHPTRPQGLGLRYATHLSVGSIVQGQPQGLQQWIDSEVVLFFIVLYMDVSENRGTPKSSSLIGFSIINHPFWGTPIFGNTRM